MCISRYCAVLVLVICCKCIECYPQGAPADRCDMVSPSRNHALANQANDSPFVLLQTAVSYKPGQVINVNIQRRTSHTTFEGFIVQAIDRITGRYIGRFLDADGLYLMDECSAVTNKDNKMKTFINLAWVAPSNQRGDVVFRGTVIERKNKYFENLLSRLEPSRSTRLFRIIARKF